MAPRFDSLTAALADRYQIEREIGQGGMATVYLAKDLKHERQVAIKVLKPELAAVIGAERFLGDIKTTANLQHPHILPLHDSGEADSFLYFVMPYVEGETLRDRLDSEKQLPIDEAVRIASEIAEALEYAHGRGVIHRDIKPANILLHEGRALVADFGIALAVEQAGGTRLTETGLSVGSPQYMSPEQATGDRELDGRSDVYSLGCLTYEMLAGDPPHTGSTAQAIFAKVLTDDPRPIRELRGTIPEHTEAAVHTAIQKLPADRFLTAGDFAAGLGAASALTLSPKSGKALPAVTAPVMSKAVWLTLGIVAGATVATILFRGPTPTAELPIRQLTTELPPETPMPVTGEAWQDLRSFDVSPDGSFIVFEGVDSSGVRLYRKSLEEAGSEPISGTHGAFYPFISPDGRWVAFFADGQLKKASLTGGSVVALGEPSVDPFGATWASDEEILVSELGRLVRFSASAAGVREMLKGECSVGRQPCWHPQVLPGTDLVLVSSYLDVAVVSLSTGEWTSLIDGVRMPAARFMAPAHLVYFQEPGRLFARTLDLGTLDLGPPIPVVDGVQQAADGEFALSEEGDLVFVAGGNRFRGQLTWRWRDGREEPLPFEEQSYGTFRLSLDGRYVAAAVYRLISEIWLYDLRRGDSRRLSDDRDSEHPIWSADGRQVAWGADDLAGQANSTIVAMPVEGGEIRTLITDAGLPYSWSESGMQAVVRVNQEGTSNDIWFADPESGEMDVFLASPEVDDTPMFSPDGKALAYFSGVEGEWEVFVTPYPPSGRSYKISRGRAYFPVWSPDGQRIYYQSGENGREFYSVDLSRGFAAPGLPELMFEGPYTMGPGHSFDVASDDERFLVIKLSDQRESISSLTWVQNFRLRVEEALLAAGGSGSQ